MPSIKIKIKNKLPQGKFTDIFKELFPPPIKKIPISKSFGIVTACSKHLFIGLQMLLTSISHYYDIPILVFNNGLTEEQIAWCKRQPRVIIKNFKYPSYKSHLQYPGAWFKPHYIAESPFKHTIWIDADAMVTGDLRELIELAHPKAFFTSDHTVLGKTTLNHLNLYKYLPIDGWFHDIPPHLNSGVFIVNNKRDAVIIKDWLYCVEQACNNKEIATAISCWDQGALKWALHKNNLLYLITPDKKFNCPAKIRHHALPATDKAVIFWLNTLKTEQAIITHNMGSPKPFARFGNSINLDLTSI